MVLIRNANGDYFAHRRQAKKKVFPGLFGLGAGGSVNPGEAPFEAAKRELLEETGMIATPVRLFELDFASTEISHAISVYSVSTELCPGHDDSEWEWSGWLSPLEVDALGRQGKLCPDTLSILKRYESFKTTQ